MVRRVWLIIAAVFLLGSTPLLAWDGGSNTGSWKLGETANLSDVLGGLVHVASLSPDGSTIASVGKGLCLTTLADRQQTCHDIPKGFRGSPLRLAWSPDSKFIAFTEDAFRAIWESDIWIFDVQTAAFIDMTDDGVVGTALLKPGAQPFRLDYNPVWDTTSADLYFFGTDSVTTGGVAGQSLYRLTLVEKSVKLISDLTLGFDRFSFYLPGALSSDGKKLAAIVLAADLKGPANGISIIDLETGIPTRLGAMDAFQVGLPQYQKDRQVTPFPQRIMWAAGDHGVIVEAQDLRYITTYPAQNTYYFDADTGNVTPLVDFSDIPDQPSMLQFGQDNHTPVYRIPRIGVVSADGSSYLYLHLDPGGRSAAISAIHLPPDGSPPTLVGELPDYRIGPPTDASLGGDWVLLYNELAKVTQG
jgi:hypothetical protein